MKCPECGADMIVMDCECYPDSAPYCTPEHRGPGCPNGSLVCPNEDEHEYDDDGNFVKVAGKKEK